MYIPHTEIGSKELVPFRTLRVESCPIQRIYLPCCLEREFPGQLFKIGMLTAKGSRLGILKRRNTSVLPSWRLADLKDN